MSHVKRRGFTLIELLVVMSIIGILMGLLLPAVQAVRARARMTQCSSQIGQVAKAMLSFESSKREFPGYAKYMYPIQVGNQTLFVQVSWVVTLTPYLDRPDLWNRWSEPTTIQQMFLSGTAADMLQTIQVLKCPSAITDSINLAPAPCSYVVNCGVPEENGQGFVRMQSAGVSAGLCFDQQLTAGGKGLPTKIASGNVVVGSMKTNLDAVSVKDGASQTILVSENLQTTTYIPLAGNLPRPIVQADVGMMWDGIGTPTSLGPPAVYPPASLPAFPPNSLRNDVVPDPVAYPNLTRAQYGRPSAMHNDMVIVAYCDGSVHNLRQEVDYQIFRQLMAPNDKGCTASIGAVDFPVLDMSKVY